LNTAHPVCHAEVDGLSEVVSLVEAGVVRTRKCDDNLSSMLVCTHHLATTSHHCKHRDVAQKNPKT